MYNGHKLTKLQIPESLGTLWTAASCECFNYYYNKRSLNNYRICSAGQLSKQKTIPVNPRYWIICPDSSRDEISQESQIGKIVTSTVEKEAGGGVDVQLTPNVKIISLFFISPTRRFPHWLIWALLLPWRARWEVIQRWWCSGTMWMQESLEGLFIVVW